MIYKDAQFEELANKIRLGGMTRNEMHVTRENQRRLLKLGYSAAQLVIDAINQTAVPKIEEKYAFIGFCPGGNFANRLDTFWLTAGICKFDNIKSKHQINRFSRIHKGDTIILKKMLQWGVSMELFAYGEVLEVRDAKETQLIYFHVDWHEHDEYLIVPAMAARSTVDVRSLAKVEDSMPPEFWTWLSSGRRTPNQHNRHLVEVQQQTI
jgi:hypothetical protein